MKGQHRCNGPSCNGIPDTPEAITAWLDQERARTREIIRKHGWKVQYVLGEGRQPAFAYTVGLSGFGHPELIVFTLPPADAAGVLNTLGERVRAGGRLSADGPLDFGPAWPHRVRLLTVRPAACAEYLLEANFLYRPLDGAPVRALQAVFDNTEGVFPWQIGYRGCGHPHHRQPLLGPPPEQS